MWARRESLAVMLKRATLLLIVANVSPRPICALQSSINEEALGQLIAEAQKAHSDALVIWKDGRLYGAWYFGKRPVKIEAMSVTKSIVGLAIGRFLTEGKIKSLDQPVWEFYPEWKQDRKQKITIRHLLNRTSCLQNVPGAEVEIYPKSPKQGPKPPTWVRPHLSRIGDTRSSLQR